MKRFWVLGVCMAVFVALVQTVPAAASGTWSPTGSMNFARAQQSVVVLTNGKVLAAGGQEPGGLIWSSAELYDPSTGTWSVTGSMNVPRAGTTTTLLQNGKVLIAGGIFANFAGAATNTAELYDPASGTWTLTGSMIFPREGASATLLANGKVLIAGEMPTPHRVTARRSSTIRRPASSR